MGSNCHVQHSLTAPQCSATGTDGGINVHASDDALGWWPPAHDFVRHVRAGVLEEERTIPQYFQPVPQYYVEVAKVLLTEARAIFGSNTDVHEVRVDLPVAWCTPKA